MKSLDMVARIMGLGGASHKSLNCGTQFVLGCILIFHRVHMIMGKRTAIECGSGEMVRLKTRWVAASRRKLSSALLICFCGTARACRNCGLGYEACTSFFSSLTLRLNRCRRAEEQINPCEELDKSFLAPLLTCSWLSFFLTFAVQHEAGFLLIFR